MMILRKKRIHCVAVWEIKGVTKGKEGGVTNKSKARGTAGAVRAARPRVINRTSSAPILFLSN